MKMEQHEQVLGTAELLCDMVLVNLLWFLCCIPIVTIGASTAALHYVTRKMVNGEGYKIVHSFFHSFRENWKQGTALWLLQLALIVICAGDFYAGTKLAGWIGLACQVIAVLTGLAALALGTMAYPLMARYRSPFSRLLKNSLLLALSSPLIVLAYGAMLAALPALALLWKWFRLYAVPVWLVVGGALPALAVERMLRPVLFRLEHPDEGKA